MRIELFMTDAAVLGEIGRRVERLRLERNITQKDLAAEAGISREALIRLEAGESGRTVTLLRVLRVLGLLERVEQLVPEPLPSPIERLRLQGRQRRRARERRSPTPPDENTGT